MNPTVAREAASATREYVDLWLRHVSDGLARVVGRSVGVEQQGRDDASPPLRGSGGPGLWVRLFGGKAGEHAFFLPAADVLRLSRLLSGESSNEKVGVAPDDRETVVQFFQQIATLVPTVEWLGFNGELRASGSDEIAWESAWQEEFRLLTEDGPLLNLRAALSPDFLSAVERTREAVKPQAPPSTALPWSAAPAPARDRNLDLLMDIELEVTLRFGQREMLLGEVLNLAPGSVIELDQQVQDPVELLVGGRVVAWGEVVTVEGNYGLHITGLASREERLESLRK
jgi:flagellar motor switch protein FliN